MSEVKRYDCGYGGARFCQGCYQMELSEYGDYVAWEDYEALQQRCAELENQRDAAAEAAGSTASANHKLLTERDALRAEVERLREIREIASQCAANGGYLCSRDLIELRELLKK